VGKRHLQRCNDKHRDAFFQRTPADVEAAPNKKILTLEELLMSEFGR